MGRLSRPRTQRRDGRVVTNFLEQAYDLSGVELFEREVMPALINREQHSNLWHFIHGR